jgi:hypothetical protein
MTGGGASINTAPQEKIAIEICLVLFVAGLLLFLVPFLPENRWTNALIPIAFVYPPVAVLFIRKMDPACFGLQFSKLKKADLKMFAVVCSLTLIPYVFLYHLWQVFFEGNQINFQVPFWSFTTGLLFHFIIQVFIVAFPEELFFRSYLQERFGALWQKESIPILAILCSNGLFALSHLVGDFHFSRLLTFFPGLVFAWLWWKTKNLIYPVFYHGLCNSLLFGLTPIYSKILL